MQHSMQHGLAWPATADEPRPIEVPSLRWDTSVLDMEEDRVIWVRESDLGKTSLIQEP